MGQHKTDSGDSIKRQQSTEAYICNYNYNHLFSICKFKMQCQTHHYQILFTPHQIVNQFQQTDSWCPFDSDHQNQ